VDELEARTLRYELRIRRPAPRVGWPIQSTSCLLALSVRRPLILAVAGTDIFGTWTLSQPPWKDRMSLAQPVVPSWQFLSQDAAVFDRWFDATDDSMKCGRCGASVRPVAGCLPQLSSSHSFGHLNRDRNQLVELDIWQLVKATILDLVAEKKGVICHWRGE